MLNIQKATTLTGTSTVETSTGNVAVVSMYASIAEDGNPNITKTILDRENYLKNRAAVQEDMAQFEDEAWALVQ